MKEFNFKGHDWRELADYFDIKQDKSPLFEGLDEPDLMHEEYQIKEVYLNNTIIKVHTTDEDEVVMIKLQKFIESKLDGQKQKLEPGIREVLNVFLDKLIEEKERISYGAEALRGIQSIKHDGTFVSWFNDNIGYMWT